ncbi:hypothetical protein FOCC_FOCC016624 [Frankliniella occidentalis]|nr:hypothetical protein FOCC_FOCC016624 [Frankliniella occidentalis]
MHRGGDGTPSKPLGSTDEDFFEVVRRPRPAGVVKNEEHIAKDENGNVVRGRRRIGSAEVFPVKMQQVPVKEQAGLSVSSQTSPAEVQQVPAVVDAGAPASPAISPVKVLQQGPVEAEAGALASAEAPLVEEQQQVPAHSALTMESDSPVSNWQAIPAAELESCTARAGGPSAGADGATEDTVLSSVDGAPTGQPGCTDESAGTDAAAFLHSMYESTRTSRSPEFVPPQWGSAHQSHQHASPAEATPGTASAAPSLTVSYPLYLYGGTKYQCPVPSGSEPTGFSTQFLTPDQSQYGCQLPQYGCTGC